MSANEGMADRVFRFVVGLAFAVTAYLNRDSGYVHLAWPATILMLTGIVGWCPLYALFGYRTIESSSNQDKPT